MSGDGRADRSPHASPRHVGRRRRRRGPSTRTTPTRAARRSPSACSSSPRPQPGERVLELACGPGGLGLAAAKRVAPGGEVVLSDVVAEMTAIAAARADALGLTNVSTASWTWRRSTSPTASYDVVLCREGLMFATDPARRRCARSGACCGPAAGSRSPSGARASATRGSGVVFDAVSAQLGAPVPPPGVPGPFSLGDAERSPAALASAGLADVVVSELAGAAARRLVRRVVAPDVRARRAAGDDPRVAARAGRAGDRAPRCARRRAPTRRRPGSSSPASALIASARA